MLFINANMHSRVGILVHMAPVDAATRSNQTISKWANPREKNCWKALDHPSANASQLKKMLQGTLMYKQALVVVNLNK